MLALKISTFIIPFISMFLVYKLVRLTFKENKVKKFTKMTNKILEQGLKKSTKGYFSYSRIESYLKKMGVEHIFQGKVLPSTFIMVKILMAIVLSLIGIKEASILLTISLMLLGFFLPDLFINLSNKEDNSKILVDCKRCMILREYRQKQVFL